MEVIEFATCRHELRKQRAAQISLVITKIGKQRFCPLFDPGPVVTASLKYDAAMTKHAAHSITIVAVIYLVRYACLKGQCRRTAQQIGRAHVRTPVTNAHLVRRLPLATHTLAEPRQQRADP